MRSRRPLPRLGSQSCIDFMRLSPGPGNLLAIMLPPRAFRGLPETD